MLTPNISQVRVIQSPCIFSEDIDIWKYRRSRSLDTKTGKTIGFYDTAALPLSLRRVIHDINDVQEERLPVKLGVDYPGED